MPKKHRDAATGQYTTAADAAARPAETVSETTPAHHETPDVAELRRLAEAATPGPWEAFGAVDGRRGERWLGVTTDMRATEAARAGDVFAAQNCTRQDALFIAAANPAVMLALLDDVDERDRLARLLDEPRRSGCAVEIAGVRIAPCDERGQTADMRERDTLADRLAHMTEARDNARAEVERLTALVEAVREYAAARQANIDHGPLLSARKAAHDALLAALAQLDASADA